MTVSGGVTLVILLVLSAVIYFTSAPLLENNGRTIEAANRPEGGASFRIRPPVADASARP
jgi:hypothetical protein